MQIYGLQGSEKIKIFHIVKISPFFFIYHFIYNVSDDRKNLMPTTWFWKNFPKTKIKKELYQGIFLRYILISYRISLQYECCLLRKVQ